MKYQLTFEDALPTDEIYQDKSITVMTFTKPKREPKTLIEYEGEGWEDELRADVERELAWKRKVKRMNVIKKIRVIAKPGT